AGLDDNLLQSRQYTDMRLQDVEGDMRTMRDEMRGGTASAMAMAGMPQATIPGGNMLAVGMGGYQGEMAMAVGLSTMTDDGQYILKANVSTNTERDFGFSVGAGYQW
ncbi:MAG TPA: YadA-like family protein, partial [Stenotrophomonas sp.]